MNDFRFALRRLSKQPGFTAIAALTLALGIGGTTAVFSVVNGVLIKPLPYPDPDALVGIWHIAPGANVGGDVNISATQLLTYREENRSFQAIGLWSSELGTLTGVGEPEEIRRLTVAYGTLQALGVQPFLGRWFSEQEDTAAAPGTIMLTHDYWQRRFGGDPSVVGRSITVDSQIRQVVGVMPKGFRFLNVQADVILPMRFDRSTLRLGAFNYNGLARLKPGVSLAQANADVARMNTIWVKSWPLPVPGFDKIIENIRLTPTLRPLKQDVVGDIGPTLWVLMGTIGFVLLIACANVANLLLVRVEGRQRELALRVALGARWLRVAREVLLESVMLGLVGGALGLLLAFGALRVLVNTGPATLPRLGEINIDLTVLSFTFVTSFLAGLLFGLIPVVKYAGPNVTLALGGGGRTASQSRERHRARNTLVVAEVALSLVLLVGSGLMIRTFVALRAVQPGFTQPDHVQLVRIRIPSAQVRDPQQLFRRQTEIRDRIAAIGGVSAASFAHSVPMDDQQSSNILLTEDRTYAEGQLPPVRRNKFVAPGFFATVGISIVAGRDLTWADVYDRRPTAVISENLAREMWREPSTALGKRIRVHPDDPWREIVGVVRDVYDDGVHEHPPATAYFPILMENFGTVPIFVQRSVTFAIRSTRAGTDSFLNEIRTAVSAVAPDVPLAQIRTLREVYDLSMARTSFTLVMLAIAGAMALMLGVIGVYGVISYAVAQRSREIGIRAALGAPQRELKGMFVRYAVVLAATGIVIGIAGATALTRLITSLLFGVSPLDPVTYGIVSLVLMVAAMAAAYFPARRAAHVNPLVALRYE